MSQARSLILEAETSCFLFWGDSWIPQLFERTERASRLLDEVEQSQGRGSRADAGSRGPDLQGGLADTGSGSAQQPGVENPSADGS